MPSPMDVYDAENGKSWDVNVPHIDAHIEEMEDEVLDPSTGGSELDDLTGVQETAEDDILDGPDMEAYSPDVPPVDQA